MTYVLVGALIAATAAVLYLAIAARSDARELVHMGDLLTAERKSSAEWKHVHDVRSAELSVAKTQLEQEQNLRAIAEVQRNTAQVRVRELLRKRIATATNEEIQELTNEAFSTPLSVAPRPPERVPQVPRSQDPRDGLLDPFASDVQPPKPA